MNAIKLPNPLGVPLCFKDWLNMVAHLPLSEIRCDVPPSDEILKIMDCVGLDRWEEYAGRLERHVANDRWVWPEVNRDDTTTA